MADNPNLAVLERFVGAVFSGDADTIHALCASEFVLHEGSGLSFAGTYEGSAGFLAFLGVFGETFEIEQMETRRIYRTDDPDYLISEMDLRATIRATGKLFETSLLERWHFRDGLVIDIKPHYFNAMK